MKRAEVFPIAGCASCGHTLCAKKVSLFAGLDEDHIREIVALIERRHYHKGDSIMHIADPFDRLFIVNQGLVKAVTYQEDGKEQILHLLSDGDSIGELALLKRVPAEYDLVAASDCHLCTIPKEKFDRYLQQNPDLVHAILSSAYDRITRLEQLVGAMSAKDADTRLRFLLRQLYKQQKTQHLQLLLTREEMANFVGVSRETISRKLSQLTKDGIIEIPDQKHIIILEKDYLE